jgi:hypothetical protein
MKNKLIKNKKADIPITILTIMVVAICILAILSFIDSGKKYEPDYSGVGLIEEINSNVEKFYFYLNVGFSEDEAAEKIGAEIINNQLIINMNKIIGEKNIISVQYNLNLARRFE